MYSLTILGLTADEENLQRIFRDFYQKKLCTKWDLNYLVKNYGYFNKKDIARFKAIIKNAHSKGYFNVPELSNVYFMNCSTRKEQEKKAKAQARVEERQRKKCAEKLERNQRFVREHMPTCFQFGLEETI
jgi:hypothetical protein